MTDGWRAREQPAGHALWVHYDLGVALRVRPINGERYEVALLHRGGPVWSGGKADVFVAVVNGMRAAAEKARWVKENVESLLREAEHEVATE